MCIINKTMYDTQHHYMASFRRELLSDNPHYTMIPHASTYQKLTKAVESVLAEYEDFVRIQLYTEFLYVPKHWLKIKQT